MTSFRPRKNILRPQSLVAGEEFTLNVISVEKTIVDLPFDKRVEHHMHRASTHGERVNGWRVETDDGIIGYGEGPGGKSGIARVNNSPLIS